jgi:hypothetical protein
MGHLQTLQANTKIHDLPGLMGLFPCHLRALSSWSMDGLLCRLENSPSLVRHPDVSVQANDWIQAVTLYGAPALTDILKHPKLSAHALDFLSSPVPEVSPSAPSAKMAFLSDALNDAMLSENFATLHQGLDQWRDGAGRNLGHYLLARPSNASGAGQHGTKSRGLLLMRYAKDWAQSPDHDNVIPLAFLEPATQSALKRQLLKEDVVPAAKPKESPRRSL